MAPTSDYSAVEPLVRLCIAGRLYEVEKWIEDGHPLQWQPSDDRKLQRRPSPLRVAIQKGFYSLVALLLANGYDPNGDYYSCLGTAVGTKDTEMVALLLRHGADINSVDFSEVLETYNRPLMDLFVEAGMDPCVDNAVAKALYHKGRPLLGFIKTHWARFPGLQRQIDIALHSFVGRKDEKGVALMLWLGADPYPATPEDPYDAGPGDSSAMESAMWLKDTAIVDRLLRKPVPADCLDHLLYTAAYRSSPAIVKHLLSKGANPNHAHEEGGSVVEASINCLTWTFGFDDSSRDERGLEALELILHAGGRLQLDADGIRQLRRQMLKGRASTIAGIVDLLRRYKGTPEEDLVELTRTGSMKRVLGMGSHSPAGVSLSSARAPSQGRSGYWKRHWATRGQ
jgi:hypothetical protein